MKIPASTHHPIQFPTPETWRDNPRLTSAKSIVALLQKAGYTITASK